MSMAASSVHSAAIKGRPLRSPRFIAAEGRTPELGHARTACAGDCDCPSSGAQAHSAAGGRLQRRAALGSVARQHHRRAPPTNSSARSIRSGTVAPSLPRQLRRLSGPKDDLGASASQPPILSAPSWPLSQVAVPARRAGAMLLRAIGNRQPWSSDQHERDQVSVIGRTEPM
jgi:hypothetical protein